MHLSSRIALAALTTLPMLSHAAIVADSLPFQGNPDWTEVLSQLISVRGAPGYLRSDNGPEFISIALLRWARDEGIAMAIIEPGKPWQSGCTESFNGKFRNQCLSLEWLRTRTEAKVVIESWRKHNNDVRPHSSLGYLTPNQFRAGQSTTTTPEPFSNYWWSEENTAGHASPGECRC